MLESPFAVPLAILATGVCSGGPTERAILAAMKLGEQPSYAWTSTVTDDARTYDVEGKRDQRGFTWMRLPMVKSIAQRLGREADSELEAVFKTSATFVIRTDRGWKTLRELPKRNWDWNDDVEFWPTSAARRANLGAAALAGLDPLEPPPLVLPAAIRTDDDESRPYSNAQFALSHPHDELAVIVSCHTSLEARDNIASGMLSDLGAQLLLVREGQDHIQPLCAAGTFKLLMKNGVVTRYHLRLEGILLIDRKKIHVHQESSTVVTNIGATTFEIPDDARRKLEP